VEQVELTEPCERSSMPAAPRNGSRPEAERYRRTDIGNSGGTWVDEEVHVCNGGSNQLVSSREPDDLRAFCEAAVDAFATA
jgi:putative intracellular protease/amidase